MAAAYVVSARIHHGRPRPVPAMIARPRTLEVLPLAAMSADGRVVDAQPAEPSEMELRWAAFRERWSQLWFFVRDPESWR
jgi:hypothetical protein